MLRQLRCLVFLIFAFGSSFQQDVRLEDNRYGNIMVAIGRDVNESEDLIARIKDVITNGSEQLWRATRHRAYFDQVTILLPDTWSTTKDVNVTTLAPGYSFSTALIRVDNPNPAWGDSPYTRQLGGCGKQGEYIHLTPNYLLNETETLYKWGPPEKTFVHEWGHLRWGLFDEYPIDSENDGHFYQNGKTIYPVSCTQSVHGRSLNSKTLEKCQLDRETLQIEKDCRYYPDLKSNVSASMMYMPFISSVTDFCDDGTIGDSSLQHDIMAPSKHNRMCSHRSAWEVMRQHEDFKNDSNPTSVSDQPGTPIRITVVQKKLPMIVVLLLDTSESMVNQTEIPFTLMIQAARYYILDLIENGTELGIITYDNTTKVRMPLTTVAGKGSRRDMVNFLPKKNETGPGAQLGDGLLQAKSVLTRGSRMIVISHSGNSTSVTDPAPVLDAIISLGVMVDTIAYSSESDTSLRSTTGKNFFVPGEEPSGIIDAMTSIAASDAANSKMVPVTVDSSSVSVPALSNYNGKFFVDYTIGGDIKLLLSYLSDTGVEVNVYGPMGGIFNKSHPNYVDYRELKQIEINIPTPEVGVWNYNVTSMQNETVVLCQVIATAKAGAEGPIRVTYSFEHKSSKEISGASTAKLPMYAQVTRGYAPVIGVKVNAILERDKVQIPLPLQDNGIGPDVTKDDGIYSGVVTRHLMGRNSGRFSMKIIAENPDNTGKVATSGGGSGALAIQRNVTDGALAENVTYKDVGQIRRVVTAEMIFVREPDDAGPINDTLPPPRITDLKVDKIDLDFNVTLTWTAVGDDVSQGNDTTYDLRICKSANDVLNNIDMCMQLVMADRPPKLAGEKENRTFDGYWFERNGTYVAIRAVDEAGNKGEPSNMVIVSTDRPISFADGETIEWNDTLNSTTTEAATSATTDTVTTGAMSTNTTETARSSTIDTATTEAMSTNTTETARSSTTDTVTTEAMSTNTTETARSSTTDTVTTEAMSTNTTAAESSTTNEAEKTTTTKTEGTTSSVTTSDLTTATPSPGKTTSGSTTDVTIVSTKATVSVETTSAPGTFTTTKTSVTTPSAESSTTDPSAGGSDGRSGPAHTRTVLIIVICVIVLVFLLLTIAGVCMIKGDSNKKKTQADKEEVYSAYKYHNRGFDP